MQGRGSQLDRSAARRGFTLTELIVAIGAVLLVTLGVGQIFSAVGRLTSVGKASAEIDATARLLEQRLREDFEGFRRMAPDETFLAIRMRELGDVSRNGVADGTERPIYLTADDLQADRSEALNAYEVLYVGEPRELRSRAVSRRLDEIIFLARAPAGRPFVSQQQDPGGSGTTITAPVARIYWGHALRPRLDDDFTPEPMSTGAETTPLRQWTPDGDFGTPSTAIEQYKPGDPNTAAFIPRGRNRFASEWMLARQPLLLFGGFAAGNPSGGSSPSPPFAIGANREFAPYVSDLESMRRYTTRGNAGTALRQNPPESDPILWASEYPDPRLLQWGRVDICAQDERDVRRWFEGQAWWANLSPAMPLPVPATPFDAGFDSVFELRVGDPNWAVDPNGPLYMRAVPRDVGDDPVETVYQNLRSLRSAIASTFLRLMADDAVSRMQRMPDNQFREQSEDAAMDLHAVLSSRCSNFEVAWSDGRRAIRPIDYDADGAPEIQPGDLIWFDVSPAIPPGTTNPGSNFRRHTFDDWRHFETELGQAVTDRPFVYSARSPRAEVPSGAFYNPANDWDGGSIWTSGNPRLLLRSQNDNPGGIPPGEYSIAATGGDRLPGDASGVSAEPNELLAIWGFRLPTADGGYGEPWIKPAFIRVRVTLHDEQRRIKDGKTYEFIFSLRPDNPS